MELEELTRRVIQGIFIPLEASGRHAHLTESQARTLFGHGLTPLRPLSQPGQFVARERVTILGPKGSFQNVAVLGPERREGQVEISCTDGKILGLEPVLRPSGSVEDTPGIRIRGERGELTLPRGLIVALRHIHMTPEDAKHFGVADGEMVSLKTFTGRPLIFQDVLIRVSPDFRTYAHIDYDEANACGFRPGDLGRILK